MLAVQWGSVAGGATVAMAAATFVVGTIVRPLHKERGEQSALAEKLAVEAAIRNTEIDNRIDMLLKASETQDRRLNRLEHDIYRYEVRSSNVMPTREVPRPTP